MGGWQEELFWSMYQIGILNEELAMPLKAVTDSYFKAFLYRPTRSEPLYRLANYYRRQKQPLLGYMISLLSLSMKPSTDMLFVEKWIEDYGLCIECTLSAYDLSRCAESQLLSYRLLQQPLPLHARTCVQDNLKWFQERSCESLKAAI